MALQPLCRKWFHLVVLFKVRIINDFHVKVGEIGALQMLTHDIDWLIEPLLTDVVQVLIRSLGKHGLLWIASVRRAIRRDGELNNRSLGSWQRDLLDLWHLVFIGATLVPNLHPARLADQLIAAGCALVPDPQLAGLNLVQS
jgi:hypothetical protein